MLFNVTPFFSCGLQLNDSVPPEKFSEPNMLINHKQMRSISTISDWFRVVEASRKTPLPALFTLNFSC